MKRSACSEAAGEPEAAATKAAAVGQGLKNEGFTGSMGGYKVLYMK